MGHQRGVGRLFARTLGYSMLLYKSALRTLLSADEANNVAMWKKRIRKAMSDKHPHNTFEFLQHEMRPSQTFRASFLTCSNCDLGHYAAQHAIRTDNMQVLVFLIQHKFMMLKQGSIVIPPDHGSAHTLTNNVYEEDEPYLYTAIVYGSCASVRALLEFGVVANGVCHSTTFLSLALLHMCECKHRIQDCIAKIELLLLYAADPLATDAQGCTSLAVLCENIHTVSLRSVLTGAPCRRERCAQKQRVLAYVLDHLVFHISKPMVGLCTRTAWCDVGAYNPLQIPSQNGNTWLLWLLVKRGVDVNSLNELGQNALFVGIPVVKPRAWAISSADHDTDTGLATHITKHRTHVDTIAKRMPCGSSKTMSYTTPLHSLQFLIKHGINATHTDIRGCTPIIHLLMHYPYSNVLYEQLFLFFQSGTDIHHRCLRNHTALSLCERLVLEDSLRFQPIVDLIQTMIQESPRQAGHSTKRAKQTHAHV